MAHGCTFKPHHHTPTLAGVFSVPPSCACLYCPWPSQAVGQIRDVVVLEFEGFAISRQITAVCDLDLGPGEGLYV